MSPHGAATGGGTHLCSSREGTIIIIIVIVPGETEAPLQAKMRFPKPLVTPSKQDSRSRGAGGCPDPCLGVLRRVEGDPPSAEQGWDPLPP